MTSDPWVQMVRGHQLELLKTPVSREDPQGAEYASTHSKPGGAGGAQTGTEGCHPQSPANNGAVVSCIFALKEAIRKDFPKPEGGLLTAPKLDDQVKEHLKRKG